MTAERSGGILPAAEVAPTMAPGQDRAPGQDQAERSVGDLERLGEYELLDKLGEGGMGAVYKARHIKLEKIVALKVLAKDRMANPNAIARFEREMKAIGRLEHPNIVQAYDAREIDGTHFLVMQYVAGKDLTEIVGCCGSLPIADACELIRQAALGLQCAHENGLVHRDIKPSNLILTPAGQVKILDLGLALLQADPSGGGEMTSAGEAMGTAEYMAPEQVTDSHNVDIRADIYGLGCTLYKLLTNRPPFFGPNYRTAAAKMVAHVTDPVPPIRELRPEVSKDLAAVLHRMLAKKPAERFATPAEVAAAMERFVKSADLSKLCARAVEARRRADAGQPDNATQPSTGSPSVDTGHHRQIEHEPRLQTSGQPQSSARRYLPWIVAGVALALVGGGIWAAMTMVRVRDKQGNVVAEIKVPEGGKVEVVDEGGNGKAEGGKDISPTLAVAPFDAKTAKERQEAWARYLGVPVVITNSIGMKLVLIPPGEFDMGSPKELIEEELKRPDKARDKSYFDHVLGEGPQHRVRITRAFYLGMYEVTQEEYQRVVGGNPSEFSASGKSKDKVAGQDTHRLPVEGVSWTDAEDFCLRLTVLAEEKAVGRKYRLPSEAQWEFACRAGSPGRWCSGGASAIHGSAEETNREESSLLEYGWFYENADGRTHAVGLKLANGWGLYDMHGNVAEWCQDWQDPAYYANSPTDDPSGPPQGSGIPHRVYRGGSFQNLARQSRSAYRDACSSWTRQNRLGLRVCLALPDKPGAPTAPPVVATRETTASHPQSPAVAPPPAVAPFDATKAKQHQEAWAKHLGLSVEQTNSIGMKLVLIPPGEFEMGSTDEEIARELKEGKQQIPTDKGYFENLPTEAPRHHVKLTKPFCLGMYPVTQAEYERVMGTNPSDFTGMQVDVSTFKPPLDERQKKTREENAKKVAGQDTSRHPVEMVSWDDCVEFCRKLSAMPAERMARRVYRLPTEAEWEYACRAGTTTRWYCGDDEAGLLDVAWILKNAGGTTNPVGQKRPNAWGLYDMHGQVYHWCADRFSRDYYQHSPPSDPTGPTADTFRVIRGGYWGTNPLICRSARRNASATNCRVRNGFRLVVDVVAKEHEQPTTPVTSSNFRGPNAPPPAVAPFDATKAKQHQEDWAKYLGIPVEEANSIGMNLVLIPPGEFEMGSTPEEIAAGMELVKKHEAPSYHADELFAQTPRHRVKITKPFYLGTYPVTQAEYAELMDMNPSAFTEKQVDGSAFKPPLSEAEAKFRRRDLKQVAGVETSRHPVETVTWDEATDFCRQLSALPAERAARRVYRLPTEAEWEYACRAGTATRWYSGDDEAGSADVVMAYGEIGGMRTQPVGRKRPNAWDLHDMYGTVWQWCADRYSPDYYKQPPPE